MRQVISQVACHQSTIFFPKAVPFRVAYMPIKPCKLAVFVSLQPRACQVYIGLLGELYSTAIKKQHRLYNHFLASTAYRYLLFN